MAEKGKEQAKFTLVADDQISPAAEKGARSLEELQKELHASEAAVKELSAAQRRLRGSSDEVKAAKAELTGKLNAAKAAISSTTLEMIKGANGAERLAKQAKAAAEAKASAKERADALGATLGKIGGPMAEVRGRIDSMKEALRGASSASGLASLAMAGLVAAMVAVAAAAARGALSLGRWVLQSANAARTASLFREAATGSAENAKNLGDQIDLLGSKVSTSKEKLQDMALALAKTRISGRAQVDTLNAIAQAADAMGDDVGNRLKDIVTRSQQAQRMFIGPQELFGTGLEFKDVAKELAVQMKVGVDKAQAALFSGQVKLDDGAKAIRAAVEKRFGQINARKLLDLNTLSEKFHERLAGLTSGVNLDVLVKPASELLDLFSESTVTGRAMKELVTDFGNGAVKAFKEGVPYVKKFIQGLVIGGLEVEIAYLKVRNALNKTFGNKEVLAGVDKMQLAVDGARAAVVFFGGSLLATYAIVRLGVATIDLLFQSIDSVRKKLGLGWEELGKAIIDGIVVGIVPGGRAVVDAVKGIASKAKDAFKSNLGIHSPSTVFEAYGKHTTEGYARGVEKSSERASTATADMVQAPAASPASIRVAPGGGGGGRASIVVNYTVNVQGGSGSSGQEIAKAASDPSILAQLTKALEDALLGAGVPLASPAGGG